jgi:hypothetical protein
VLALDEIVDSLDHGLAGVEADFLKDGQQRFAELVEILL